MKSIIAFSAMAGLVPVALTAPSRLHLRSDDTQEVNVMIQQVKSTSETDIAVVSQDTSKILGYSCSSTLSSGAFADLPITADIDENGAGTLTVGSTTYKVHEDRDTSGGIACARIFNDGESFLDCAVPVPSSVKLSPVSDQETTCFNSGVIPSLQSAYKSMLAQQGPPETAKLTRRDLSSSRPVLDERQCGIWSASSQVVGDGNPHQNYYLKQLSVSAFVLSSIIPAANEMLGKHKLRRSRQLQRRPIRKHILHHRLDSQRNSRRMADRRFLRERNLDDRKHILLQRRFW